MLLRDLGEHAAAAAHRARRHHHPRRRPGHPGPRRRRDHPGARLGHRPRRGADPARGAAHERDQPDPGPAGRRPRPPPPVRGRMTGAEAVIRCLEAEGVDICWGIPGGAILPAVRRLDARRAHRPARPRAATSRAPATWRRATRASPARSASAWRTSGPGATNLVTPIADAFLDSTPLVAITGQVPTHLIGTDAFQEADITGIVMPIVEALLPRAATSRTCRARSRRRSTSPAPGRPGPGADRHPEGRRQRAPSTSPTRRRSTCRATSPTRDGPPAADPGRGRRDREGRAGRSSTSAAACVNADAEHELIGAGRGHQGAGRDDADGEGRVPRLAPAEPADARHARLEVRQLGAEPRRPADHRRRALRRPRHRQARRASRRAPRSSTWTSTRPRSPRTARPTCRSSAS